MPSELRTLVPALLLSWQHKLMTSHRVKAFDADASDEKIITDVLTTNDPKLYGLIVSRYRPRMTALARTTLSHSSAISEVDDVVQDAFVQAYDNLRTFRQDALFRPWLYRILLNKCKDKLRAARHIASPELLTNAIDRSSGPLEMTVMLDETRRIEHAVSRLPENLRIVFLLRHMDDLSYADLAAATGSPVTTVKTQLFRARSLVRETLKAEME